MQQIAVESPLFSDLEIPDEILDVIGYFAVLWHSVSDVMSNQEVLIENCDGGDVTIDAPKIKLLTIKNCSNLNVRFYSAVVSAELHNDINVQVQCLSVCNTFRLDGCQNCKTVTNDLGQKISYYVFDSKNTELRVQNVVWEIEPPTTEAFSLLPHHTGDGTHSTVANRPLNILFLCHMTLKQI